MYQVTKTYGHELGLSACFRQWRADSHCRFIHGYALSFKFTFTATELDKNGWVVDFGGLKDLKKWLEDTFDHKLVIAEDDPQLTTLMAMSDSDLPDGQLADVTILPRVGCEAFAFYAYSQATLLLLQKEWGTRVRVLSVEVREHGANSAIFVNPHIG